MKDNIHPKYVETKVTCGCGNTFMTRSTQSELKVDICSACHPFYTGKLKYVDTAGRIEKFQRKFSDTGYASLQRGKKKAADALPPRRKRPDAPCTAPAMGGDGRRATVTGTGPTDLFSIRLPAGKACPARLRVCLCARSWNNNWPASRNWSG